MANPEVQIDVSLEIKKSREALENLDQQFAEFANNVKKNSRKADTAFGVFIGNLASSATSKAFQLVKAGFNDAFQESLRFNRALKEIETILPRDVSLTKQLSDELSTLGKRFGTGATNQAKAFYQIISAGITDTLQAQGALNAANLLSTGGLSDLGSSIDVITDILNVYKDANLTAGDAADTLFKSVQLGKLTVDSISDSIGQALPSARALGIGLEEVASALVVLTKNGFKANEAAVRLRALFSAVAKDGGKLGDQLNSSAIAADGLGGFLQNLAERTKGSADATAELFGNVRAQQAALILANKNAEDFTQTLAEYETKAGAAAEASNKIVQDDLSKQIDIAKKSTEEWARTIFDDLNPALLSVVKLFNRGFDPVADRTIPELQQKLRELNLELANTGGRVFGTGITKGAEQIKKEIQQVQQAISDLQPNPQPLILKSEVLRIQELKNEIAAIESGVSDLGPLAAPLRLEELKRQLADATAARKAFNDANRIDPSAAGGSNGAVEASAAEQKALIDLQKTRDLTRIAEEDARIREREARDEQTVGDIEKLQALEDQKLQIAADAQTAKNNLLNDGRLKDLAQEKVIEDLKLKRAIKNGKDKVALEKRRIAVQRAIAQQEIGIAKSTADLIGAVSKDGSKVAFLAQKAAAIAGSIVNTNLAFTKAQVVDPTGALGARIKIQGAIATAAIAASAIKGFQNGGFVGGASRVGDNNIIRVNSDEAVLNTRQQREFMRVANGQGGGSSNDEMIAKIDQLISAVSSQPVSVQIDGREVFRAVRNEAQDQGVA